MPEETTVKRWILPRRCRSARGWDTPACWGWSRCLSPPCVRTWGRGGSWQRRGRGLKGLSKVGVLCKCRSSGLWNGFGPNRRCSFWWRNSARKDNITLHVTVALSCVHITRYLPCDLYFPFIESGRVMCTDWSLQVFTEYLPRCQVKPLGK